MNGRYGRRRFLAGGVVVATGATGCLRLQSGTDGEPTADFTYEPETPRVGEPVEFDASPSSDPDGDITEFTWALLSESGSPRPIGTGPVTTHRFGSGGDHRVGLQVFDDAGNGARHDETITVEGDVAELGDRLGLEWATLYVPAEDGEDNPGDERNLAFACQRMVVLDEGTELAAFDIGGDPEPILDTGVHGPESRDDGTTFRWFGAPDRWTRLVFPETDLDAATTVRLVGHLPPIEEQSVDVSVNGTATSTRSLTEQSGAYDLSVTA